MICTLDPSQIQAAVHAKVNAAVAAKYLEVSPVAPVPVPRVCNQPVRFASLFAPTQNTDGMPAQVLASQRLYKNQTFDVVR